jgi:hypothetical protein
MPAGSRLGWSGSGLATDAAAALTVNAMMSV